MCTNSDNQFLYYDIVKELEFSIQFLNSSTVNIKGCRFKGYPFRGTLLGVPLLGYSFRGTPLRAPL